MVLFLDGGLTQPAHTYGSCMNIAFLIAKVHVVFIPREGRPNPSKNFAPLSIFLSIGSEGEAL